jgi:hypothetical protein
VRDINDARSTITNRNEERETDKREVPEKKPRQAKAGLHSCLKVAQSSVGESKHLDTSVLIVYT